MKTMKYIVAATALMLSTLVSAQGFKVCKSDVEIDNPATTVERIEFYPAGAGSSAPGFKVHKMNGAVIDYSSSAVERVEFYPYPIDTADKQAVESVGAELVELLGTDLEEVNDVVTAFENLSGFGLGDMLQAIIMKIQEMSEGEGKDLVLTSAIFHESYVVDGENWVSEGTSDHLQFSNADAEGNKYKVTVYSNGTKRKVLLREAEEDEDDFFDDEESKNYYVEIPEEIIVDFTLNGSTILKIILATDNNTAVEDLMTTGIMFNLKLTMPKKTGGTFTMEVNRLGFDLDTGINMDVKGYSDKDLIFSGNLIAAVDLVPDEDGEPTPTFGEMSFNYDFLGKAQLKGTIQDPMSFVSLMLGFVEDDDDDDYEDDDDESFGLTIESVAKFVETLNEQIKSELYLNNQKVADLDFTMATETNENGEWPMVQPVLHFTDGSTETFMSFFSGEAFGPIMNLYTEFLEKLFAMVAVQME